MMVSTCAQWTTAVDDGLLGCVDAFARTAAPMVVHCTDMATQSRQLGEEPPVGAAPHVHPYFDIRAVAVQRAAMYIANRPTARAIGLTRLDPNDDGICGGT